MDWTLLGIEPTKNKKDITAAYRARVRFTNPEEQPEAFMALRAAYEEALRLASEPDQEGPLDQLREQLKQLYGDFARRQQPEAWEALLSRQVFHLPETREAARKALLEFLPEHYYLPKAVWQVLEDAFQLSSRRDELVEFLPEAFVDQVLLSGNDQEFGLPMDLFQPGRDGEACDNYTRQYFEAFRLPFSALGELLDQLEALPEQHPYGQSLRCTWLKENGEPEKAAAGWQRLAETYPDDANLVTGWAEVCLEKGDHQQAEALARHVLSLRPGHVAATELLANAMAASGRIREAKDVLYQLQSENASDPNLNFRILETLKRWNQRRIGELKAALAENPADGESRLELCWCLIQNQMLPEAQAQAALLDQRNVNSFDYQNLMGKLHINCKRPEEALVHISLAEQALRAMAPDGTAETEKRLRRLPEILQLQGGILMELGRLEASREKLEAALALEPNNPDLLTFMGRIFQAGGDHESCIRVMEQASRIAPGNWLPHYFRALSFYRLGRDGEAFQAVNTALGIHNRELGSHILKMRILLRNGAYDAVRECLAYLEKYDAPMNAAVLFVKAQLLESDEEDLPGALRQYRHVQKLVEEGADFQDYGPLYYSLARLWGEIENPGSEELVALLDKGLAEDPEDPDCLGYKAWILKQDGKLQEAVDMYLALMEKPCHLPSVEWGLAKLYYEDLEQWADKALACYETLLRKQQTPELYFYAANCKRHMGDYAGAREYYRRELELDPQDVDGWTGLAHICNALGDFRGAAEKLDKALEAMETAEKFYAWIPEQKAISLRRLGQLDQAAETVEKALERYDWPDGWQLLFDIRCQNGDWLRAGETLNKWRAARPTDVAPAIAQAHMHLLRGSMFQAALVGGMAKRRMSREQETDFRVQPAEMESNHRRLIGIWSRRALKDPNWDLAYVNLALAYRHKGDLESCRLAAQKALRLLDKAVKGYSVYRPLILTRRAVVLGLLDRMEEAYADLAAARSLPLCENCPYGACKDADIYEATLAEIAGDREKALELYRRGGEKWPDDLDFVSGVRRLKRKERKKC